MKAMAMQMAGVLFAVASLLSFLMTCQAKEYTVGDEAAWTLGYDYQKWAAGKTFYVGDTLVFNYFNGFHNVVRVNGTAFAECVSEPNMGLHESGSDKIVLSAPGDMWFICGIPGHCAGGMKLKITVKKPHSHSHNAPAPANTIDGTPASSPTAAPAPTHDRIFFNRLTWLPWH